MTSVSSTVPYAVAAGSSQADTTFNTTSLVCDAGNNASAATNGTVGTAANSTGTTKFDGGAGGGSGVGGDGEWDPKPPVLVSAMPEMADSVAGTAGDGDGILSCANGSDSGGSQGIIVLTYTPDTTKLKIKIFGGRVIIQGGRVIIK